MTETVDSESFRAEFDAMARWAHAISLSHGWWEDDRGDAVSIALMHAELSEALEQLRSDPSAPSKHIPAFTGVEEEFADVIIRIMDCAQRRGYDVAGALTSKMAYNERRPYKHGGKRF